MDINQASRNIKRTWVLSAIAYPAILVSSSLNNIIKVPLHLFIPFGSALGLLISPLVLLLTFTVYKKSRPGAIFLFTVYFIDRVFTFILVLYLSSAVLMIIWFCIALFWGFIFVQGIRGTLAYHRLFEAPSEAETSSEQEKSNGSVISDLSQFFVPKSFADTSPGMVIRWYKDAKLTSEKIGITLVLILFILPFLFSYVFLTDNSSKIFPKKMGIRLVLGLDINNIPEREKIEDYTKAIIYERAKQMGVRRVKITSNEEGNLFITLPGVKDTQKVNRILIPGYLEFKLLDEAHDLNAALEGNIPPGSEVLYEVKEDPETRRVIKVPYLIKKRTLLTEANLTDARIAIDPLLNEPYISIDFDKKGAKIFERITEENIKKRLAIVIDKKVLSAPIIQEKITGGQVRIAGNFTTEEANALALALRYGPLPNEVHVVEMTQFQEH